MSWAPLLLVLSALCAGSAAQFLSNLKPSESVSPGGTAIISCSVSTSANGNYLHWVQQRHGNVHRLIMQSISTRPDGIPARFSGSRSGNTMSLTLTGARAEDDGDYYCVAWSGSEYIFGGGTQLNVLSGETKVPTLDVFPPSSEEVATNKATLVCLLSNFYPGSVTMAWKADDQAISSGVETTRPAKQTDNNLFMASSYLSVPAADWSTGKKYTCQATHESKIIEKSLKHSECV